MSTQLKGILYGMGNPLLDMTAVVDEDYLKRYDLQPNNAVLAEEKHRPIFDDINENYKVSYSPGGATQNSIRVAQWYLNQKESGGQKEVTSFVGCIGKDTFGEKLQACMKKEGIRTNYLADPAIPTGVCAVLITGGNRSLVTRLDAANNYKHEHLTTAWNFVTDAQFFYIAGYFLTVSPESMLAIGEHALEQNKCFSINLSAPFLSQFFKEPMTKVIPYVDILFGNDDEAMAFAKDFNLGTKDIATIAQKIAAMPKKNKKRERIVLITCGDKQTVVFQQGGRVKEYPVIAISQDAIVDTNGAGDAFVGGFLAEYVLGKDLDACVENGHKAAHMIIQVSGCTLPESADETRCCS